MNMNMKLTTAICKAVLVSKYSSGDWKRTKKYKEGEDTVRIFTNGNDTYKVVSKDDDTWIASTDKIEATAEQVFEIKDFKDILKALKNIDQSLYEVIENDCTNCKDDGTDFAEYLKANWGAVGMEMDACLEWIEAQGINYQDSEEEEEKGTVLLMKHLEETVPAWFPYKIQTEDFVTLWEPKQAQAVAGVKKVPLNKYLFSIFPTDDNRNLFQVAINPVEVWTKEHCLASDYTTQQHSELYSVFDEIELSEGSESIFGFQKTISQNEARKIFLERNFVEDEEFNEFIMKAFGSNILKPQSSQKSFLEEKRDAEQKKIDEEERLENMTEEQRYVEKHYNVAIDIAKKLDESMALCLILKYLKGYKGDLKVVAKKMEDGTDYIPSSEYIRAYLVNEKPFDIIKELMEIR